MIDLRSECYNPVCNSTSTKWALCTCHSAWFAHCPKTVRSFIYVDKESRVRFCSGHDSHCYTLKTIGNKMKIQSVRNKFEVYVNNPQHYSNPTKTWVWGLGQNSNQIKSELYVIQSKSLSKDHIKQGFRAK